MIGPSAALERVGQTAGGWRAAEAAAAAAREALDGAVADAWVAGCSASAIAEAAGTSKSSAHRWAQQATAARQAAATPR